MTDWCPWLSYDRVPVGGNVAGGADGPLYVNNTNIPTTMDNAAATVNALDPQKVWRFGFVPKNARNNYNRVETALAQWAQWGHLDGTFRVEQSNEFVDIVYAPSFGNSSSHGSKRRRID